MVHMCADNHHGIPSATGYGPSGPSRALRMPAVVMVMAAWPLHGRCVDLVEAVKQRSVFP